MVNAFWLDRDLAQAARWLVDAHVTSSVFECSMVLTTAVQLHGYGDADDAEGESALPFTHPDHPLTQWAADAYENWASLRAYTDAAHDEWRYRWDHGEGETHASWATVAALSDDAVRALDWPTSGRRDPPQLTGEWRADDYVDAYRYYYANDKRHLFRWSKDRREPPWIDVYTVDRTDQADDASEGDTA